MATPMTAPILMKNWKRRIALPGPRGATPKFTPPRAARPVRIGDHFFPKPMRAIPVRARDLREHEIVAEHLRAYRPSFAKVSLSPAKLPRELTRRPFLRPTPIKRDRGQSEVTTIYAPDERYTFSDTSYPWSACGLVQTGAGSGSGVMIGPRHVLTASHAVNWGANNTAGWATFAPDSFDGNNPFGEATATDVYFWLRADSDHDGSMSDNEVAFDYVVLVLDTALGNTTGWMGSRVYDTGWDGKAYWGHVGYPGDLSGGQRPAFIGLQGFQDTFSESTSGQSSYGIEHKIDVWPGQSGGPFFGWWDGDVGPAVVGVQSGQNRGGAGGMNTCGGGDALPTLVSYARTNSP